MRITLNTGRKISLARLYQWRTYAGVLAGMPNRRMNMERIQRALLSAREYCIEGAKPFLIKPRVTPIEPVNPPSARLLKLTGRTAAEHAKHLAQQKYEKLPALACIGVFDSDELNKPGSEPYSSLTIVWFQDDFALPIEDSVQNQIRRIDWDAFAVDWMW